MEEENVIKVDLRNPPQPKEETVEETKTEETDAIQSKKQRKFLFSQKPQIAKRWAKKYGTKIKKGKAKK